tara:strand:+ start:232 stop:414 length:183 start_codon:yes stop_codon:yes gene_type:complete
MEIKIISELNYYSPVLIDFEYLESLLSEKVNNYERIELNGSGDAESGYNYTIKFKQTIKL